MKDIVSKSYISHEKSFKKGIPQGELERRLSERLRRDTILWWKYNHIMKNIDPLLDLDKSNKFLTIGDGRFGLDSHYISSRGLKALPTDISDYLLNYSLRKGVIESFKKENAENLSFQDEEFDFTFCKESYHHFPRPTIALYEMLRVSRKGVILIEPVDPFTDQTIIQKIFISLFSFVFKIMGKKFTSESFEEDGNYIYRLSKRELVKASLALGYSHIAFKGVNEYNCKESWANFDEKANLKSKTYRKTKFMTSFLDFLNWVGLFPKNLLIAAIFKRPLEKKDLNSLKKSGFDVINLPKNPYL